MSRNGYHQCPCQSGPVTCGLFKQPSFRRGRVVLVEEDGRDKQRRARESRRERVALSDVGRAEEVGGSWDEWEKGGRGDRFREDPRRGLVIGQKSGRDLGGDEGANNNGA